MQAFSILNNWYRTQRLRAVPADTLAEHRAALWQQLQPALAKTPALARYAGAARADVPMTTPMDMRADISRWNSLGICHDAACAAALRAEAGGSGEVLPGVIAGYSTGTSGSRGVFLATAKERAIYAGQSLAKLAALPMLVSGVRIMLFLRANSRLYSEGKSARLFDLRYCPINQPAHEKAAAANAYNPHILIAPAHVLAELAENGFKGEALRQCFYGAEPMGDLEKDWIGQALGVTPCPIYQATEGFVGFTCRHGRLHLNEDSLAIDYLPVAGTNGVQIAITDLLRTTQPMVNVVLDDFIEPDHTNCPCGFAGRTILPVAGRVQNLWRFGSKITTPRQVTDIMERTLGAAAHWAAHASSENITLYIPDQTQEQPIADMRTALYQDFIPENIPVIIQSIRKIPITHKRSRVIWHG